MRSEYQTEYREETDLLIISFKHAREMVYDHMEGDDDVLVGRDTSGKVIAFAVRDFKTSTNKRQERLRAFFRHFNVELPYVDTDSLGTVNVK